LLPLLIFAESVKPRGVVDLSKVQDVRDGRSVTGKANTVQLKTASGGSVCYVCESGTLGCAAACVRCLLAGVVRVCLVGACADVRACFENRFCSKCSWILHCCTYAAYDCDITSDDTLLIVNAAAEL
jgi:hypothetical protein